MLSGPRRSLLATALSNVADVTVQMVADDSSIVPSVLTELNYSIHIWPTHAAKVHSRHTAGTAHMLQVMAVIRLPGNVSLSAMH